MPVTTPSDESRTPAPGPIAPLSAPAPSDGVPSALVLAVLAPATTIVLAAVVATRFTADPHVRAFLDNLHWTVGYAAGAALAWLGARHAPADVREPRRWFALGLACYAVGQVLWDAQVAAGWNPFPGPSDALFIVLGPACAVGLARAIGARTSTGEQRVAALDVGGLSIAALAFTLATYLPLRGQNSVLQMAVLVAYPVGLLTAACAAVVMIPALRLRPDRGGVLFLVALGVNGWLWMEWNARTLAGTLDSGSLYNAVFSFTAIGMGLGVAWWRPTPARDARWERRFDAVLRLLPLLLVIGSAFAVIASFTAPGVPTAVQVTTGYAAALVVMLALVRQHVLLAERDRLLEARSRYRTLFDSAPDAILLLDGETFVDANPAALRLYGVSHDELCRMTPADFSPRLQPDGRPSDEAAHAHTAAARGGASRRFAWQHVRRDGSAFDAEVSLDRVLLPRGTLVQAIVRDVTDRNEAEATKQRLEEQLRHAARLESVGRLAGGVAHDFNNVLTVILGTTELAMQRPLDDATVRDLGEIRRSAQRAAGLTAQLLAFSRKQVIAPVASDPNALVKGLLEMLRRLIGEDVELVFRPGRAVGTVMVDPTQMEQVLVNLAANARDAMSGGGRLMIATRVVELGDAECAGQDDARPGRFVQIEVRDDGPGIPADVVEHVFEPFYTTKAFGHGTGLGLSTVYGIVRQSDGFIRLETAPGEGACFRIHLPEIATAPDAPVVPARDPLRAGREHVLLVEDEAIVRDLAQRVLTGLGYRVTAAESGKDALHRVEASGEPIDLLLTDVIMPHMSGRDLHVKLCETRPGLPVIYMSGYTDNIIAPHGVLDPGTHFLQKPFTLEALTGLVRSVLDAPLDDTEPASETHAA